MRTFIFLIYILTACPILAQDHTHKLWNALLEKHVDAIGQVDYSNFIKDSTNLNSYLLQISKYFPTKSWTKNEVMAYWINAYNAFTIQLILRNYPLKSIKDIGGKLPFINSTWDIKFIKIGKEMLDLNTIEHLLLRKKFKDPRLHMALVCASRSCPALLHSAFTASALDKQLDDACISFITDPIRNRINPVRSDISLIFKWYTSDFKQKGGIVSFINAYSKVKITNKTQLNYLEYDWALNDK